jgi:hypothetical protein
MQRAASIARISAVLVSLVYMVLALPHFGGIEAQHFSSGWFLAAMAIALAWLPLLLFNRYFRHGSGALHAALSLAPLILMVAFFSALFAAAA